MNQIQTKDQSERTEPEPEWTKVESKRKPKKPKQPNTIQAESLKEKARRRLPEAVAVKVMGQSTYADILRKIKKEVDPESCGVTVSGIRRTRGGELLVEIKKRKRRSKQPPRCSC